MEVYVKAICIKLAKNSLKEIRIFIGRETYILLQQKKNLCLVIAAYLEHHMLKALKKLAFR